MPFDSPLSPARPITTDQSGRKEKAKARALLIPALCLLGLTTAACTQAQSPGRVESHAVGEARRAQKGVIENVRFVTIENRGKVGTVAGAGIGAAAGSTVGNGAEGVIGAIAGALIGGAVGRGVDKGSSRRRGVEYVIRMDSGDLVSIVQMEDTPLAVGSPVIVTFGRDQTRVTFDAQAALPYRQTNDTPPPDAAVNDRDADYKN
ncbi:outer membrane lipoprotein [Yunchengibacter salinarum]|uniref:outer membrane lipoprotein n=1 Tax=Yunchengibacter salinarum TaxID=3133399 RepID=UPI0035B576B2